MEYIDKDNNNNKDNNNEKGISALGLDKDLGFSRGDQGQRPHDDDDEEEDNDKGDTNNKDGSNNMYDNDDKSISSLGQDRDLWFSLCLCSKKIWKKGRKIHNC